MKKTIKSLIIASSVAATVGIGAISFAAWSAGNVTSVYTSGTTGTVNVNAGTLTVTNSLDTKKLVPFNQTVQYDSNTMDYMQTITLKYNDAATAPAPYDAYTYKLIVTNTNNLPLKYQVKSDGTTVNAPATNTTISNLDSAWKDMAGEIPLTLNSSTKETTVYVILASDSGNDMNKSYTLTFYATAV